MSTILGERVADFDHAKNPGDFFFTEPDRTAHAVCLSCALADAETLSGFALMMTGCSLHNVGRGTGTWTALPSIQASTSRQDQTEVATGTAI